MTRFDVARRWTDYLGEVTQALAADIARLQTRADSATIGSAALFAADQIRAAASQIRWGALLGTAVVDAVARIRYGRGYTALDRPARYKLVGSFATARVPLLSDFMGFIRSLVLVRVYEQLLADDA